MEMSELNDTDANAVEQTVPAFCGDGMEKLHAFQEEVQALQETMRDIECIGGDEVAKKIRGLMTELDTFEPSITMIGQIKSGKTTLVNAMAGRPDLLPADVNPWTSVVTSLHFNAPRPANAPIATFQFFNQGEWEHLVENGGRMGELSSRAGADQELEKVQRQVAEMREKTKERLGRKFELLLGQEHRYQYLDDTLVQRYVCMGDEFDDLSVEEKQGQFADITKSADLYLTAANIPRAFCIRDTPGVNDTFMMREQITIKSIRDSKICVVVLSAHQALSATDMGLIRLISNVKSRQVVIFVNRIDELQDPAKQIPEIRASLLDTLANNSGPENPAIVFGSGYWANMALLGTTGDMIEESAQALENYAASDISPDVTGMDNDRAVWANSGLPALFDELCARIVESSGAKVLASSRKRAANYVAGLRASSSIVSLRSDSDQVQRLSNEEVQALVDEIERDAIGTLHERLDIVFDRFSSRTDQAHKRFLDRALESLLQHLELYGDHEVWQYSPDGLRMLLRTGYQVMRRNYADACDECFEATADILTRAYGEVFAVQADNFQVEAPSAPDVPPPVTLAQTIALDLKTSWWKGWWGRRKGYRAFASGFYDLIEAETSPIVDELKIAQADEIRASAEVVLREFLSEQRGILADICVKAQVSIEELHGLYGVTAQDEREELFDMIFEELDIDYIIEGEAA